MEDSEYKKKYFELLKTLGFNKVELPIDRIKQTFPYVNGINLSKLQFTEESVYSMTGTVGAKKLSRIIKKYVDKKKLGDNFTITDGTANIGSDTINLAILFPKATFNSIEITPTTCELLKHNIDLYKLNNRVNVVCDNTLLFIEKNKQDVIYLDPPWGGPKYIKNIRTGMFLGDTELYEIVNQFRKNTKLFVFKVPKNYDFNMFLNNIDLNINVVRIYKHANINRGKILFFFIVVSVL